VSCKFRIANRNEIDKLLEMRLEFVKSVHPEYDSQKMDELSAASLKYIKEHIDKNMYAGFFGEVDKTIVCSTSLLIYHYPPLFSSQYRKIGHLLNFYTREEHRHRGYGLALMEYVKQYAKSIGIYKLDLSATVSGYSLYQKCGFTDAVRIMEFEVDKA
jgi:GNAT superfamily N-acetyltransferase